MNRLELLGIAAAFTLGSTAGFFGAGWRPSRSGRPAASDRQPNESLPPAAVLASVGDQGREMGQRIAAVLDEPLRSRRVVAMNRLCEGLDVEDVRSAVGGLAFDGDQKTLELRKRLLGRWAELEPASAAEFALRLRDPICVDALESVLEVWLHTDAEAAKRFVAAAITEERLAKVMYSFVVGMAERDLDSAIEFSRAVPSTQKMQVVWAAFRGAAASDPGTTAARALTMPEGDLRIRAVNATISLWMESEPHAGMAWVMQRPNTPAGNSNTLLAVAMDRWAYSDPAAAAQFLPTLPTEPLSDHISRSIASTWARRDFPAAMQWAQRLRERTWAAGALGAVVSTWAFEDPVAAAEFVRRQPASSERDEMFQQVVKLWAGSDPKAALAWSVAQPEAPLLKSITPEALGQLAVDDPAGAIAALGDVNDGAVRKSAAIAIAQNWATRDAAEAAQWALELPPEESGNAVLKAAVSRGTFRNSVAMAQWLNGLQGHARRDVAVEAFVGAVIYSDPAAAADWANTLADGRARASLVANAVGEMARYNPSEAREWLMQGAFADAERKALLHQIEKAGEQR